MSGTTAFLVPALVEGKRSTRARGSPSARGSHRVRGNPSVRETLGRASAKPTSRR
jgi:hypothetical protein